MLIPLRLTVSRHHEVKRAKSEVWVAEIVKGNVNGGEIVGRKKPGHARLSAY
jgi:hypothetical protein